MFNLTPAEVEEAITTSATLDIAAGRLGISRKQTWLLKLSVEFSCLVGCTLNNFRYERFAVYLTSLTSLTSL